MKLKLMIVDDHQLVIDGIKCLLKSNKEIAVIDEALNGKEALEKLAQHKKTDIILMDIYMPVMNGYEATKEIVHRYPRAKIIALSMFSEKALINKMMLAGVSGYLIKTIGKDELFNAIKQVADNKKYFNSHVLISLSVPNHDEILSKQNKITPASPLTGREIEILRHIAQGFSNKEISKKLIISYHTVDNHRTNIMKKLNAHNIAGIIRYAIQNNLIE